MYKDFTNLIFDPYPHRTIAKKIVTTLKVGSYEWRVRNGFVERPHYGYCIFQGALLAKRLGYDKISVIEFGVAGGNGLVNIEYHAEEVSKLLGIGIEIYGFDTGEGLPNPVDFRDLPYHWQAGFFKMDLVKLKNRLRFAKLVIGDIRQTITDFLTSNEPAPVAAVMHDFDFYSSTMAGLQLFDAPEKYLLPRIYCYFDDTIGTETELYNDYSGERLAINEFNQMHDYKKLCIPYHLLSQKVLEPWYNQIFIFHSFKHSKYNQFVSNVDQQIRLD